MVVVVGLFCFGLGVVGAGGFVFSFGLVFIVFFF